MDLPRSNDGEARFSVYVEGLTSMIGHADRAKPLRDYCLGLMMPCERKSVEPIAAITAPKRTAASVASSFCRRGRMVGREGSREGAGTGAAKAGTPRADRSMDH